MPPRPQVQKPGPAIRKTAPAGSILARIKPVEASKVGRLKCSFYGVPKTGKTRLACTFPKPLLIIGAEDGTASVTGKPGVEFVLIDRTDDVETLIDEARSGRWKTVVLDTATKLRDMRITEIFASMGMVGDAIPERKPFLYADKVWKSVWIQCAQDMRDILRPVLDLPRLIQCNVIVIAQEAALYQEEGAATADPEFIKPKVSSALGDKLANWLNADCDYICQTFIRAQTREKVTVLPGNKKVATMVRTGKAEYCLRIGPHETYITGFRIPEGMALPDSIVNPSYDKIVAILNGTPVA